MRISHCLLFAIGATTIAYVATAPGNAEPPMPEPSASQPADPVPEPPSEADRNAEMAGWSPEMRTAYEAWPEATKRYYWSLTQPRQRLFWALAESDRIALTAMTGTERDAAWTRIEARAMPPREE